MEMPLAAIRLMMLASEGYDATVFGNISSTR